ncbi:MAG: Jag N-terminal domain-containing protein [bacterium]|nr:Jag N-terminal domain-containing protein [bacterium]MCY4193154.1 Jag N-terminal domain-containing protein [bacterium]
MEWLEVTGKTIAQAEEAALDRLGVDRSEAEFSVVDEPKSALLGLRKTEARIRARVRPAPPREKRSRSRRSSNDKDRNRNRRPERGSSKDDGNRSAQQRQNRNAKPPSGEKRPPRKASNPQNGSSNSGKNSNDRSSKAPRGEKTRESKPMEDPMSLEEQSTLVVEFLDGLLDAFELDAEVSAERVDDETVEMRVENVQGVGLLIGSKGNTLRAVEDLSRMLVQRSSDGNCEGRIRVDIGGYRERRRAALEVFSEKIASEVRESGEEQPLEPMNAADRKVVHDVVSAMEGVSTVSEGQEPRRWVLIIPD